MDLRERDPTSTVRHPWEVARAQLVLDTLRGTPAGRVLDVGAGDCFVAQSLVDADPSAQVCAVDAHFTDEDLARYCSPRITPSRALPDGPFDTALLLDVLEHVEDDDALLGDVVGRVHKGGRVLISVPAWPQLFSSHDRALGHVRRYHPRDARALIGRAGLELVRGGGAFLSLVAPRAAAVALERLGRTPRDRGLADPAMRGPLGRIVGAALALDGRVARTLAGVGLDAPGLSFVALCRRPA